MEAFLFLRISNEILQNASPIFLSWENTAGVQSYSKWAIVRL